jgi:mannose-6-phosphate isomerase-like protein (cupin superfamily)
LNCTPSATTRLLQLRDALAVHAHADLDEVLYVVAGEGAIRIGEDLTAVGPGSLIVVPRNTAHAIDRRGRSPLILLSVLAGAPCPERVAPGNLDNR